MLREIIAGATGFLSCWRKLMVLGPGGEFALIGAPSLKITLPSGWQARVVDRRCLYPAVAG